MTTYASSIWDGGYKWVQVDDTAGVDFSLTKQRTKSASLVVIFGQIRHWLPLKREIPLYTQLPTRVA